MKILFIHQRLSSFVKNDLDILHEKHEVREISFNRKKRLYIEIIPNLVNLLKGVIWCDISFSWFGKLHAFFAVLFCKLFGKKSIVIAGGDDVAFMPDIKYGLFCSWWKKWIPLFVFKYADLILPVSEYNKKETLINAKANSKKVKMIYHGFKHNVFKKNSSIRKENIVITVGGINKETEIKKGIKLFIESAKYLQKIEFYIIGYNRDNTLQELKKIATDNVKFTGALYNDDLINIYSRAKVYVQISIHESFGCSLAEAMLCECIPLVSKNGAIPEVAGNDGIYVDDLTPEKVAEKIKYALDLPDDYGKMARNRIIKEFDIEERRKKIINSVEELIRY